jgi:hypothetical protein
MAKKRTTTTKAQRDPVYGRARELIKLYESGASNMESVTDQLRTEFGISLERAEQAAARAARIKRHAVGTPPNTSLILTEKQIAYCEARGGKSAVIHDLIDAAMSGDA